MVNNEYERPSCSLMSTIAVAYLGGAITNDTVGLSLWCGVLVLLSIVIVGTFLRGVLGYLLGMPK